MHRFLKIVGYLLATLVVVVAIAAISAYAVSSARLKKTYAIRVQPVVVPTDSAAIEQGRHLAITRGCTDCHGADLGGATIIDDPAMGLVSGANLTKGKGGVTATFTDDDWVRAIRHGVGKDGRGLFLMPSLEYAHLSEADLGNIIAYARSVPPVDRATVPVKLGPIGRVLLATGGVKIAAAELDHAGVRPENVKPGATIEYGRYLAIGCIGCHGPNYSGGKIPGGAPDWPPSQNLTPRGDLGKWTEADFVRALRTAKRPDGTELSPVMPRAFGQMNDQELTALWMFLKTLPPAATASR